MWRVCFLILATSVLACKSTLAESLLVAVSPSGHVRIEFSLRTVDQIDAAPHYRVTFRDKEVIGNSRLGFDLEGGDALGGSCEIVSSETRDVGEAYIQITGKRREVESHWTETTVLLQETTKPRRKWELIIRACDDGVAFRYRFPKQEG